MDPWGYWGQSLVRTVKLFVEGGGSSRSLHSECRAAFCSFLEKAGLTGFMPRIVSCGSRNDAYSDYCTAIKNGEEAMLLVDSESAVIIPPGITADDIKTWKPWHHLKNRKGQDGQIADNWNKPAKVPNTDCHLMVMLMESWFLADVDALKRFYGQSFNENCLPNRSCIESIPKDQVITSLRNATRNTQKGEYTKGDHSFKILEEIDPQKITSSSPWANRFIVFVTEKMISIRTN